MFSELTILLIAAASVGFLHTVLGPDHYLPFVVMSRAGKWSPAKTAWVTLFCGLGHVGSSVVIGLFGIMLGVAISRIQALETVRGEIAAWLLIGFGLAYFIWGLRQAYRSRPHQHGHVHLDGSDHAHPHTHNGEHLHPHCAAAPANITPWIMFTIFVLGPCEPLIPLLMYPAAKASVSGLLLVILTFSAATIGTMLAAVAILNRGMARISFPLMERYSHAIAGMVICLSGVAIKFLGL